MTQFSKHRLSICTANNLSVHLYKTRSMSKIVAAFIFGPNYTINVFTERAPSLKLLQVACKLECLTGAVCYLYITRAIVCVLWACVFTCVSTCMCSSCQEILLSFLNHILPSISSSSTRSDMLLSWSKERKTLLLLALFFLIVKELNSSFWHHGNPFRVRFGAWIKSV